MAKKKTAIDKAIDGLQAEINVLQLAIDRLKKQQAAVSTRITKPRAVPPVAAKA